jgi:hypothetical protein
MKLLKSLLASIPLLLVSASASAAPTPGFVNPYLDIQAKPGFVNPYADTEACIDRCLRKYRVLACSDRCGADLACIQRCTEPAGACLERCR